eukprot:scaffold18324_cov176-Amphora_coffeaeformis.AAC.1
MGKQEIIPSGCWLAASVNADQSADCAPMPTIHKKLAPTAKTMALLICSIQEGLAINKEVPTKVAKKIWGVPPGKRSEPRNDCKLAPPWAMYATIMA